jgi:rSAM/selenodomain-associated transferase 1
MTRGITEVLIIFARAPEAGRVKTRLIPGLGAEAACALHAACVLDVHARHADHAPPPREVVLYRAGDPGADFWRAMTGPQRDQRGVDLGERMAAAIAAELARAPKVVILGADSPTLPPERVDAAFAALDHVPVVLGPAEDGGYYLLGARDRLPPVFHGPAWGTARVLADTCDLLDAAGLRYQRLEDCFDVDRPEDLERLRCAVGAIPREGGIVPARVAAWLAGWGRGPRETP